MPWDTDNGVLVYTETGGAIWGVIVNNTHDVAAVYASTYYA